MTAEPAHSSTGLRPRFSWRAGRFEIDLGTPRVMGIVNITPDSFSDGDPGMTAGRATARCERLVRDGADMLDLGGESSRPGADPVPADVEMSRVLPVLRAALAMGVAVSVDSAKPEVMRAALDVGADIVNDIGALQAPGAMAAVAAHPGCGVCLMHMRGTPQTMREAASYGDVVAEVAAFLRGRVAACVTAGIDTERIVADPGIGFAKTPDHNLALLARQKELIELIAGDAHHVPLLTGWSRKSTLAKITGVAARPPEQRSDAERATLDAASVIAALLAVERGASIVRVHDVAGTVAALAIWKAARRLPESWPGPSGPSGIIRAPR